MCISNSSPLAERNGSPSSSDSSNGKNGESVNKKEALRPAMYQRRGKRVKQASLPLAQEKGRNGTNSRNGGKMDQFRRVKQSQSKSHKKHKDDEPSGGIESIIPSLLALIVLACGFAAKMGFRGRATVAGIDLGTTNSVICVQEQAQGANCKSQHRGRWKETYKHAHHISYCFKNHWFSFFLSFFLHFSYIYILIYLHTYIPFFIYLFIYSFIHRFHVQIGT